VGYNSKPIRLAFNSGIGKYSNITPGFNSTSKELPICFSEKNFSIKKMGSDTAAAAPWVVGTKEKNEKLP
jgi:hypothetical protein